MALSLLRLRLDPLSFSLPDGMSVTKSQKIANYSIRAFAKAVNAADNFLTNGALHGRNITNRPGLRALFSRVTPRFAPYFASLTSTHNLQMIGGALTIMFLASTFSDEKNVQYAAEKLNTITEYVTEEVSAAWDTASNIPTTDYSPPHFPHYI